MTAKATATLRAANASSTGKTTKCGTQQHHHQRHRWARLCRQHSRSKSSMASVVVRPLSRSPSLSSQPALVVPDQNNNNNNNKMPIVIEHSKNHRRRKQHQLVVASSNTSVSSASAFHHNHHQKGYPRDRTSEEEEERLAAMRLFLDSLQLATANTTLSNTITSNTIVTNTIILSSTLVEDDDNEAAESSTMMKEEKIGSSTKEEPISKLKSKSATKRKGDRAQSQSTPATTTTRSNQPNASQQGAEKDMDFDSLKSALRRSIYRKDVEKSMFLFRESQRIKQLLPRASVTGLFFMVSETDPISAYSILQYYNSHYLHQEQQPHTAANGTGKSGGGIVDLDSATNKRRSLYKRIANSISLLDPQHHNTRQMHVLVDSLLNEVEKMDSDSKRVLYPKLIVSLVSQRIATIGPYAHKLYESMVDQHGSGIKAGWLNKLLSLSRYNRQNDVPYHDVMAQLVQIPGGQLNPESVLPAIQNMFPFTDTEALCVALRAWLEDFRNKYTCGEKGESNSEDRHRGDLSRLSNPEDLIDLSTLENISIGASQAGSSELILLVWDVLEACHYPPTETIYENTVMTFANEKGSLEQAFAAMTSMKEDGFLPSRPLLRSVSSAIRLHRSLIGRARRMLIEDHQNGMAKLEHHRLLSLESLNVVLSSYAERGDPRDAVEILELMAEKDIEPNADSFSFVIEALGRDIKKRLKTNDHDYIQRNISIANTVLSMMEGKGEAPNTHVIRNYVELLCLGGETETATSIVEDYLSSADRGVRNTLNNITIYRVASEHAALGNFERAKALAKQMTEFVPALHRRIRSKEQRSLYLQETIEASLLSSGSEKTRRWEEVDAK
jgi:pentatricopeptide repeat protein